MQFDDEIVPELSRCLYVSHPLHRLLAEDAWRDGGPNIGSRGENLTISFLSLNRASLSARLIRSIVEQLPDFAGELLVVDNGSLTTELNSLRASLEEQRFRWRIIELGRNYGVAGGRNRTIPYVKTDWLMCLDNDIYFIGNPLATIQRNIAQLGCHFVSLPLLQPDRKTMFARGGHLYLSVESGELHIGAGSVYQQTETKDADTEGFLSTFLFGGACVLNRHTFQQIGGYDEAMFVGFEDIDFSIRLFRAGYKVGSIGCLALVHEHPKPDSTTDLDYEKARFARQVLMDSAGHLEAKHGFKVWSDAVDHWLANRKRDLGFEVDTASHPYTAEITTSASRRKIALITDTDNWAFGNISRQLQRYLSDRYEFVVIPMDVIDNIDQVLLMTEDCELIHFFWREHLTLIGTPYYRDYVERLGWSYDEFDERFLKTKRVSTAIYDHLLLEERDVIPRRPLYTDLVAGYSVASQKLFDIYAKLPGYPSPKAILEDGVDLTLFKPRKLERFRDIGKREIVIGWVGNSKWAAEIEDFKGFHTILQPALAELQAEGLAIRTVFADRQERFIPHEQMPDYYSEIDLYICTSRIEGTPNPVLEAMACGVPVISTDVGIVPQVFGAKQRRYMLTERSGPVLKQAIREMIQDKKVFAELSSENLKQIRGWDWSVKAEKFADYFRKLLK